MIAPSRWVKGTLLPFVQRRISQEKINLYADASGDYNPIHVDNEFAARTPLRGTVAHGMLILAYASLMLTDAFGESSLTGGKLNVRFKKPAKPGDTVTVRGQVSTSPKAENGRSWIRCRFWCENQKKEELLVGDARVPVDREAGEE